MIIKLRKKLLICAALVLLAAVLLGAGFWIKAERERASVILEINGEKVTTDEAMIYWRLMQLTYEDIAGPEVWDMDMLGFDPRQSAVDRVIESIIRIKLAGAVTDMAKSADVPEILSRTEQLASLLGEEYMERYDIDTDLLEKVVRENYLASRYEESANFRTSEFEADIEEGLQDRFGAYDEMDKAAYLQNVSLIPLMIYTGQMTGDEWVSYPETQCQELFDKAAAIRESVDYHNFFVTAKSEADNAYVSGNPVFSYGAVTREGPQNKVYMGQMPPEVAEIIQNTPCGGITDVMETEYGYLICLVISFQDAEESDYQAFDSQLLLKKAEYKNTLLGLLKQQRMEEEWTRLEQESAVIRYRENLSRFILENEKVAGEEK